MPAGYDGKRPYPAILFLHGDGEKQGGKRDHLAFTLPPAVRAREDTLGFIVICPQGRSGSWAPNGANARNALKVLDHVMGRYNIDRRRIALMGVSTGGAGVWDLAATYPKRWAAIVPVASIAADPSMAAHIATIPCWCFHNAHDRVRPPTIPRRMIAALRDVGGSPRYTEFVPLASDNLEMWRHNAWEKAFNMPELYEWLMCQRRP